MDKNIIIKQLEHIINYEYQYYSSIDELIRDLEKIVIKKEKVFNDYEIGNNESEDIK